ncbi:DIL domain-containing protein [Phthorimaea operculella]|nr:DIL domain-containing protein [Phthorimaea operculella]
MISSEGLTALRKSALELQLKTAPKYRLLCPHKDVDRNDVKATCERILKRHIKDPDKFQFGATKIFFRAGQVAYLEKIRADIQRLYCVRVQSCVRRFVARRKKSNTKIRADIQRLYCVRVQSCVRRFVARRKYLRLQRALRGLQAHARGYLARRKAQEIRRNRAAIKIQRNVRGWLARVKYQRLRKLAIGLQAHARGYLARRLFKNKKLLKATITIQRYIRGYLARKRAAKMKRQIIVAQAAVRRFLARRQYKRLRIEARSLDHVKTLNKGLENKIISLQQRLGDAMEKNKMIEPLQQQIADLKAKLELLKLVEIEFKTLKVETNNKTNLITTLQAELEAERDSNRRLIEEKKEIEEQYKKDRDIWEAESEKLAKELQSSKEHFEMAFEERDKQHEAEKRALSAELEAERQSRQKLLSSQYELQERLDSLQRAPQQKEHRRSLSDASNNSQQETTVEDDYGYGSVRSVETTRPALEAVNWSAGAHNGTAPVMFSLQDYGSVRSVETTRPALEAVNWSAGAHNGTAPIADAGLVLRMQNKISALQSELSRTSKRANDLEERLMNRLKSPPSNPNEERFKVEELEIENKKLREHLDRLRATSDSLLVSKEIIAQLGVMQNELDRRRDECIQLKSVLSNQEKPWYQTLKSVTSNLKSLASSNYGADVDIINEDGELATAYEAQKGINRQLQEELQNEKRFYSEHISKSKAEIDRLREENERYQKLLSADLSSEPKTKEQEFAQNEIIRLASETMALQERVDKLSESCRRYKNQIRLLVNKLKDVGVMDVSDILESSDVVAPTNASLVEIAPVTRKKEREYLGMFEYKLQDEAAIIKKLILDLKPRTAVNLLPGLPAFILFMILRHMDHVDDEPKMHGFMKSVRSAVKRTLKKRSDNVEYNVLWLANMLRLLNNLRQYSGDAVYQIHNTPRQNQQCLRIFDLSEYRQVLSDTAVSIYQGLILLLERQLERLIVPAVLEHEEISGLSGPAKTPSPVGGAPAGPSRLKQELSQTHTHLHTFDLDPPLRCMIFKQLFYYICAYSLNQLLLRKDLCCWAKGLQIRYNISHLETWIKENLAEYGQKSVEEILSVLRPITQVVQLLQARKSMDDVQSTVDMCDSLTAMQVCKILNMYTPAEEYEVKVTREFIHAIQKKMQERAEKEPHSDKAPQNLLMDSKMIFSVQFPFSASPIRLEDIELPEVLGLDGLLTKI